MKTQPSKHASHLVSCGALEREGRGGKLYGEVFLWVREPFLTHTHTLSLSFDFSELKYIIE
jgi:hypothetical protein